MYYWIALSVLVVALLAEKDFQLAEKDLQLKNELKDSPEDMADIVMKKVDEHCKALNSENLGSRKKRQSEAGVRATVLQSVADCGSPRSDPLPTNQPSIDGPCMSMNTVNLTGSWRLDSIGSHRKPANGFYACDRALQGGSTWFRFTGSGGNQLANRCRPAYSCGGHGGFWSNAQMPTTVGEIRRVPIYGSWNSNCNWYTWPTSNAMVVQRCSSRVGDFVYTVRGTSSCYWTFCGMNAR